MIYRILIIAVMAVGLSLSAGVAPSTAFTKGEGCSVEGGGCASDCLSCHSLSKKEAGKLLKADEFDAEIVDVKMSPVKGLWQVEIEQDGRKIVVYIDFAEEYLVQGKLGFTPIKEFGVLPKIELSKIPYDRAIIIGDKDAKYKVAAFSDPDCPYCQKLHKEMKLVVEERKDIAFYILLFPLPSHQNARAKSTTVICERSAKLLDDAMEGKSLPEATCETTEVSDNIALGKELGVNVTPTLILPTGSILPGYLKADELIKAVDEGK